MGAVSREFCRKYAKVSAAYPLYSHVTKKEREKIAPEMIRLTDELMK
ncbi:MAG: hypothetical protein MR038_07730 [Oscillospiraceae bacterium]|nr:hypothetical protein [Oscillospiraceae bacterium]